MCAPTVTDWGGPEGETPQWVQDQRDEEERRQQAWNRPELSLEDRQQAGYGGANFNPKDLLGMSEEEAAKKIAEAKYGWKPHMSWSYAGLQKAPGARGDTTIQQIKEQMRSFLPQLEQVSEKDIEFAQQDRQRAMYGAQKGYKQDMYGLQQQASKAGQQMQQAYGSGMGSSMRGAVGGQQAISMGYGDASADLTQARTVAQQDYDRDIYGLEKAKEEQFESDFESFLQFKQGGRVPSKKSFLETLTALPDAKGS